MEYIITKTKYEGDNSETHEERFEGSADEIAELLKLTKCVEIDFSKYKWNKDAATELMISKHISDQLDLFTEEDLDRFKNGEFAIHCKSRESAVKLFEKFIPYGLSWINGFSMLDNYWSGYKENTCYYYRDGLTYGELDYFNQNNIKVKVYTS